jgi:hypothetical protein
MLLLIDLMFSQLNYSAHSHMLSCDLTVTKIFFTSSFIQKKNVFGALEVLIFFDTYFFVQAHVSTGPYVAHMGALSMYY